MDMILFEEHRLDSTTTDITTALFILYIMSLYCLILWNHVNILQNTCYIIHNVIVLSDLVESREYSSKHFKKDHE